MNGQNFATELSERKSQKIQQVQKNKFKEKMFNHEEIQTPSANNEEIDQQKQSDELIFQGTEETSKPAAD